MRSRRGQCGDGRCERVANFKLLFSANYVQLSFIISAFGVDFAWTKFSTEQAGAVFARIIMSFMTTGRTYADERERDGR